MSEWEESVARPEGDEQTVTPGADVVEAAQMHGADAQIAGMNASMQQMQTQIQAMQQMQMRQMQQMQASAQQQQLPQEPIPASAALPNNFKIDEDDPYFDQFAALANQSQGNVGALQGEVAQLKNQLHNMTMNVSRQNVQTQVDGAMTQHQVPEELANDVRTTVYAYMAATPANQQVSADHLVSQFMQNLGRYQEVARKQWAAEAKKPKPFSTVASQAGIPDEAPKSWDDAKARSLAFMKAITAA